MSTDVCPYCKAKIQKSFLKKNSYVSPSIVEKINKFTEEKNDAYCEQCVLSVIDDKIQTLEKYIKKRIHILPILTCHTPFNWEYDSIGIVTGQSTTGTGFISEMSSSVTDFLGADDKLINSKLSNGEEKCFLQLRLKACAMGGNGIIATDIDYSEVGGGRGMLMVCASGTAINLRNIDILGKHNSKELNLLSNALKLTRRLKNSSSIKSEIVSSLSSP